MARVCLFRTARAFESALTSDLRVLNCPQLFGHNEMTWLHGVFGARYRYCPLTGCDETGGKPIRPSTRYATALIAPALSVAVAVDSKFYQASLIRQ